MKIAVNCRFLLKNKLEGIGWYTYEVVKRMVTQHPEDEFLFLFDRPFLPDFVFASNISPIVVHPPARHPVLWWSWFEIGVTAALKKHKPDVFLSPDGYLSLRSKIPAVMVTHDIAHVHYPKQVPWLVRSYYNHYVPKFLHRANHVVTVSHFTKADIKEQYGIDSDKMTVAPNGCRPNFQPVDSKTKNNIRQKYADGHEFFFYLGAVHPRKNLERLLTAFDQFKQQTATSLKLLIAGRLAWQTKAVQTLWRSLPSRNDITFLGYVPEEDLPKIMGSSLALIYVSLFEGFGLPVLEAMHCEIPVVTSNNSALQEIAGEAALTVAPSQTEEITHAMIRIYQDAPLRQELVEKGKNQRKKYNWDNTADILYKVCRKIHSK